MTIVIKNKTTKSEIKKILEKYTHVKKRKSLRNVFGKFNIEGDALEIQKKMRDEWN
jgi:hypothetical protein